MAHEIYVDQKGKAGVFVVGEPAWHKLGKTLDKPLTAEEAIKEAGLDYTVEMRRNHIQMADGSFSPSKSFSSVRTDTQAVLGSRLGNRYQILQNVEAFKFFDQIVDRDEAVYHSAGVLGQGERVWIMAKLPEHISIKGIDDIEVFVTMFGSHDGSSGVSSFIHANRIVCNNTLQAAMSASLKMLKYRHTGNIVQQITEGAELMGIHNMLKNDLADAFNHMVSIKTNTQVVDNFLAQLFPIGIEELGKEIKPRALGYRQQVLEALENGAGQDMVTTKGTGFGLYNAVTFYIDNMKWKDNKRKAVDQDAKLKSNWFGGDAALRQRAFDLVMAI